MPTFHSELLATLSAVNASRERPISYRRAVVEGMQLRDSFCSKITADTYKPTRERLESLARLLGIPATRFSLYKRRLVEDAASNPAALDFFAALAALPHGVADELLRSATRLIRDAQGL